MTTLAKQLGAGTHDVIVDPVDATRRKKIPPGCESTDLLVPVARSGKIVYEVPSLQEIRERVLDQLGRLHPGIRRLVNPHRYPAGLERDLHELRTKLTLEARGVNG